MHGETITVISCLCVDSWQWVVLILTHKHIMSRSIVSPVCSEFGLSNRTDELCGPQHCPETSFLEFIRTYFFLCVRFTTPVSHWAVLSGIFIALLGWYAACSSNSLPIGCPKTSVLNCHYTLRNSPEERGSRLIPGGSLKSRVCVVWRLCKLLIICMNSVTDGWNSVEHWQNDTKGGRRKYCETNTSQYRFFFFTTNLTWIGLWLNAVPRGDGPGTNPLIHSTSFVFIQYISPWLCFV